MKKWKKISAFFITSSFQLLFPTERIRFSQPLEEEMGALANGCFFHQLLSPSTHQKSLKFTRNFDGPSSKISRNKAIYCLIEENRSETGRLSSKGRVEDYNTSMKRMMRNPYEYHHDLGKKPHFFPSCWEWNCWLFLVDFWLNLQFPPLIVLLMCVFTLWSIFHINPIFIFLITKTIPIFWPVLLHASAWSEDHLAQ